MQRMDSLAEQWDELLLMLLAGGLLLQSLMMRAP
jgi:hypothetical protein